jgi:putative spermidine/putrescine transport system substrate-binding protein
VSFAKLAAQVRTGVYEFDVTTLGVAELGRANHANLIDKYDESKIPPSSLWPGAVTLNGVNSHAFVNVIAYRKDKFPNGGPQNWAEFWDAAKFPGSRCLQNYPARVLAFALMADGVEPANLFPYDLDRAFKSLDKIKKDIRVWRSQSPQSQQLLRDGEVELIGMWSTSAQAMIDQKVPIEITFNQAVIDVATWVVARDTPRAKNAWRFIEFAVSADRLAQFAQRNNYGPMNPASFKSLSPEAFNRMPTSPANLPKAVVLDAVKLAPQFDLMSKRFEQWLSS